MRHFEIGDVVYLKAGWAPQIVIDIKYMNVQDEYRQTHLYCKYLDEKQIFNLLNKDIHTSSNFNIRRYCTEKYPTKYRKVNDYKFSFPEDHEHNECIFGNATNSFCLNVNSQHKDYDPLTIASLFDYFPDINFRTCNLVDLIRDNCESNNPKIHNNDVIINTRIKSYNERQNEMKGNIMNTNTLFQVKGTDLYGHYLTENSEGKAVLEMKSGPDNIKAYKFDEIEEVVPWTFTVKWLKESRNTTGHYKGAKDCVKKNDVFLSVENGCIGIVTEVNTKNKSASYNLRAKKLVGLEDFNSEESESK